MILCYANWILQKFFIVYLLSAWGSMSTDELCETNDILLIDQENQK